MGLERLRLYAGAAALLIAALPALSCSKQSDRPADQVIKLHLVFDQGVVIVPETQLTVAFDGYKNDTVALSDYTPDDPERRSFLLRFLLPALGSEHIDLVTLTTDTPSARGDHTDLAPGATIEIPLHPVQPDAGGMAGATGSDAGTDAGGAEHPMQGEGGQSGSGQGGAGIGGSGQGGAGGAGPGGAAGCDDAGAGGAGTGPSCDTYCTYLGQNCASMATGCLDICRGLRWEAIDNTNTSANDLTCRIGQAQLATDQDNAPEYCAAAVWNGQLPTAGTCGGPCQVFCDAGKTNCGAESIFAGARTTCIDTCAGFSSTSLQCRVDALVRVGLGTSSTDDCATAAAGIGCPQ
jgi:hypothetical protein